MAYRGPDRRRPLASVPSFDHAYATGVAFTIVAAAGALGLTFGDSSDGSGGRVVDAVGAFVISVAAALCWWRWRFEGSAVACWAGVGLLLTGPVTLALRGLSLPPGLPAFMEDSPAWVAALLVGLLVLGGAAMSPAVDVRVRWWRLIGLAATATLVLTVLFTAAGVRATPADYGLVPSLGPRPVFFAAWSIVAGLATLRGRRGGNRMLAWLGLTAGVLAMRSGALVLAAVRREPLGLWFGVITVAAGAVLCLGLAREVAVAIVGQRRELLLARAHEQEATARAEVVESAMRTSRHEALNALTAIAGATEILERQHRSLPEGTRAELAEGILREVERLQRVVTAEPAPSAGPSALALRPAVDDGERVVQVLNGDGASSVTHHEQHRFALGQGPARGG